MQEVVKKEVLKGLDHGIVYPIFYSKWVSLVQIVPKQIGITVIRDNKNKLISLESNLGGMSVLTIENSMQPLAKTTSLCLLWTIFGEVS